ncbi:hypothetical protein C2I27_03440 [Priestia megaterium]|uniref:hypothetical protein n=1 Tax=Priestia megaterium TaxID=1404 RepID=UPI000D5169E4|nr:hypothetical protein [Priestia megaterium]PVC74952.1 hypothetical protein C2I27_03440 [Priestia megaterium]
MLNLKEGDIVSIDAAHYKGPATINYIARDLLYAHHMLPIQCEISEEHLDQFEDHNHGQTIVRFSLRDLAGNKKAMEIPLLEDNIQGTLF